MNLNELWIGDTIRIKSTGIVGVFHGISQDGKALIKIVDGNLLSAVVTDIEIYSEPDKPVELTFPDDYKTQKLRSLPAHDDDTIDLHYDHLIQYFHHEHGHILDFQLEKCEEFIVQSIESDRSFIRIIYGKGEGVLKKAVDGLIQKYAGSISLASAHFDGASVDVWFK